MNSVLRAATTWCGAIAAALGELVMPVDCPCGVADVIVCSDCLSHMADAEGFRCDTQATRLRRRDPPLPTYAGLRYEGPVRRCLLDFKDASRLHLARHLAPALGAALAAVISAVGVEALLAQGESVSLVPVPASAAARARRGEDHVVLLLREWRSARRRVMKIRGREEPSLVVRDVLRVVRRSVGQKSLTLQQRGQASVGKYAVRRRYALWGAVTGRLPLAAMHCIVVDDVVTSGSTLEGAVFALERAGAQVHGAACLAATPRH